MLDKILNIADKVICLYNYYKLFIALLIDRYYDRLLPLLGQFVLIPNRINKFMDPRIH